VKFEKIIKKILLEVRQKEEDIKEPWIIEITENLNKSKEYNVLGKLIIKLASLRSNLD
jgi:hypothetical protein